MAMQTFEMSSDLEFEHYLCEKLGMTVAEMRRRMSSAEFLRWGIYYARIAQREELERAKLKARTAGGD